MKLNSSLFIASTLGIAGLLTGLLIGQFGDRTDEGRSPSSTLQAPSTYAQATTSTAQGARMDPSGAAWARLVLQKIDAIEQRLDKEDRAGAEPSKDPAQPDEPPQLTIEQLSQRNRRRIERIDAALVAEPHNGQWARDTSQSLQGLFTTLAPAGSALDTTTCGETYCRMTFSHDTSGARDAFEAFPRKIHGMGLRGLIEEGPDGKSQTTLYVVRREYDTPDHPVRMQEQG